MLVNPLFMFSEANHLIDLGITAIWDRMTVDREAMVTNPFQVAINRLKELYRGDGRHGSCGMGIGETMQDFLEYPEDALRAGDLEDPILTEKKLRISQERKIAEMGTIHWHGDKSTSLEWLAKVSHRVDVETAILQDPRWAEELANGLYQDWKNKVRLVDGSWLTDQTNGEGVVIFEGAQGVLLDENFGFHPHTTWSTTTYRNAYDLLREHSDEQTRVGVIRSYMTRHGAGPFATEDPKLKFEGEHNTSNEWQQGFRVGHLDLEMFQYARRILGGIDMLALTHMDKVASTWKVCASYKNNPNLTRMLHAPPPAWLPNGHPYRLGEPYHLARQQEMGQLIQQATPVYYDLKPGEVIDHIRAATMLYSYGPTFEDKTFNAR
jgi:adenylosuccinate synthase